MENSGNTKLAPRHLALLHAHDAARGLSHAEIDELAEHSEVLLGSAGDVVHAAGDSMDSLFIVAEGRLKLMLREEY